MSASWIRSSGGGIPYYNAEPYANYPTQKTVGILDVQAGSYPAGTVIFCVTDFIEFPGDGAIRNFFALKPGETTATLMTTWMQTGQWNAGGKRSTVSFVVRDGVIHAITDKIHQIGGSEIIYGRYVIATGDWYNEVIYSFPGNLKFYPDIDINPAGNLLGMIWTDEGNHVYICTKVVNGTTMPIQFYQLYDVSGTSPKTSLLFCDNEIVFVNIDGNVSHNGMVSELFRGNIQYATLEQGNSLGSSGLIDAQICLDSYGNLGLLGTDVTNALIFRGYSLEHGWIPGVLFASPLSGAFAYGLTCRPSENVSYWFAFYKMAINTVVYRTASVNTGVWSDPVSCALETGYPTEKVTGYFGCQNTGNPGSVNDSFFGLVMIQISSPGASGYELYLRLSGDLTIPPGIPTQGYYSDARLVDARNIEISIPNNGACRRDCIFKTGNLLRMLDWIELSDGTLVFARGEDFVTFEDNYYQTMYWLSHLIPDDVSWKILTKLRVIFQSDDPFMIVVSSDDYSQYQSVEMAPTDSGIWKDVNIYGRRFFFNVYDNGVYSVQISEIQARLEPVSDFV